MRDVASHARTAAVVAEEVGEPAVWAEAPAIQAGSQFLVGLPPTPAVRELLSSSRIDGRHLSEVRPSSSSPTWTARGSRRSGARCLRPALRTRERLGGRAPSPGCCFEPRSSGSRLEHGSRRRENRRGRGNRRSDRRARKSRPGTLRRELSSRRSSAVSVRPARPASLRSSLQIAQALPSHVDRADVVRFRSRRSIDGPKRRPLSPRR